MRPARRVQQVDAVGAEALERATRKLLGEHDALLEVIARDVPDVCRVGRGSTSACPRVAGLMSAIAIARSLWVTTFAGSSPATILQKMQSVIDMSADYAIRERA